MTTITIDPATHKLAIPITDQMRAAAEEFLALGVQKLQDACNARREWFLKLSKEERRSLLDGNSLAHISDERAIAEASPPFQLFEPGSIWLEAVRGTLPGRPDVPMFCSYEGPQDPDPTVTCFLGAIRGRDVRATMFHEMIHACGDRDRSLDGIIRLNMIGREAVKGLIAAK